MHEVAGERVEQILFIFTAYDQRSQGFVEKIEQNTALLTTGAH